MISVRVSGRIPRQIDDSFSVEVTVDAIALPVFFERARPRVPVPDGGAPGSGSLVEVRFEVEEELGDEDVVGRARDFLLRATNRALHFIAYLASNQKRVALLVLRQFEDVTILVGEGESSRSLQSPAPEPLVPIRLKTKVSDPQAHIDAFPKIDFSDCNSLWTDVLESYYEGRYREVLMFVRALVEAVWNRALERAFKALELGTFPGDQKSARALKQQAGDDRMGLPDRLSIHAPVFFGFSFLEDFDKLRWDQFKSALSLRNEIAHDNRQVTVDEAWRAMSACRVIIDKILELAKSMPVPTPQADTLPPESATAAQPAPNAEQAEAPINDSAATDTSTKPSAGDPLHPEDEVLTRTGALENAPQLAETPPIPERDPQEP